MAEKLPALSEKIACNSVSIKFETPQSNSAVRYHSKIPFNISQE